MRSDHIFNGILICRPRLIGAEVAAAGSGELLIKGISSERTAALLTEHTIAFSEVSAHRATLEEAYLKLTREAVEFRAAEAESASW